MEGLEEDAIALGREVDDAEPVRRVNLGQQRRRSGRHVEHAELSGSSGGGGEGDPITGWGPYGVPTGGDLHLGPISGHLLRVGTVGLGNDERRVNGRDGPQGTEGQGDTRSIGRERPSRGPSVGRLGPRKLPWCASVEGDLGG